MKRVNIPAKAPYSESQRAWLGGFFAGMHSHLRQSVGTEQSDARMINILYGTQTGNSESVANDAASVAKAHGLQALVKSMDEVDSDTLATMEYLLIVTSTYGEGEMPDNAQMLWDAIAADNAPRLENMKYSVLALGDTSYDLFCKAGIEWDERLVELGASRLHDRVDCDVDFDELAEEWVAHAVAKMAEGASVVQVSATDSSSGKPKYNRKNPFITKVTRNRLLTSKESSKETRHYEFSLEGSGLSYEAGDALNVVPLNCPALVADIIAVIDCDSDLVESFAEVLRTQYEIKLPSKELLQQLANHSKDKELNELLQPDNKEQLSRYLWGRDTLDLLRQFSTVKLAQADFIALLKPLQHRAYSISSSGKMHSDSVHLTIASVRYNSQDRDHKGVCSTYLADLVRDDSEVKIFFSPNKSFRVPEDDSLPIIMVGPGTGIAPFRAFLQEREFRQASGKNWLLFGDRNAATDYIYQDEIEAMQASGLISHLDLAFSRDQAEKIYVQDRMVENGAEMYQWLEKGGSFFVCGDASRMAKDVDKALHRIIEQNGQKTAEQAIDYVNQLKKEKRYVRDVY